MGLRADYREYSDKVRLLDALRVIDSLSLRAAKRRGNLIKNIPLPCGERCIDYRHR